MTLWLAGTFCVCAGAWCLYQAWKLQQHRRALDHLLADLNERKLYLDHLWDVIDARIDDWLAPRFQGTTRQKETRH